VAVSVTLTPDTAVPAHGTTLTLTYKVTGNDPVPPAGEAISGTVDVGGTRYDVTTTVTLPGSPAKPVT
jgi:hypothetical protein